MNYIFFNPRNWFFEQPQHNNLNTFSFSGTFQSGNKSGFTHHVPAERSFINDFDGGLVESLMFGDWNASFVRAISKELLLTSDTDYQFVFWLNGGENDKNNEICQLQIAFSDNWDDCYTYKLNRNYIKPLLHKDGWELYSIPFHTSEDCAIPTQIASGTSTTTSIFLSFVSGNAPMALKPAKEPEFYADWKDAPDEFAAWRPQRHNLVFADGWPSINQYGGDKYSTEALRARKEAKSARQANRFSNAYHYSKENIGNVTRNMADSIKNAAQNMADIPPIPPIPFFSKTKQAKNGTTFSTELTEQLKELTCQRDDLVDQKDDLRDRFNDLRSRVDHLSSNGHLTADSKDFLNERFSTFELELNNLEIQIDSADNQVDTAESVLVGILNSTDSQEQGESYLASLEYILDMAENFTDSMDDNLDSLEEYLDSIEDTVEE